MEDMTGLFYPVHDTIIHVSTIEASLRVIT